MLGKYTIKVSDDPNNIMMSLPSLSYGGNPRKVPTDEDGSAAAVAAAEEPSGLALLPAALSVAPCWPSADGG